MFFEANVLSEVSCNTNIKAAVGGSRTRCKQNLWIYDNIINYINLINKWENLAH